MDSNRKEYIDRELIGTAFDSITDIIVCKDGQGRWQEANKIALKYFNIENVNYKGLTNKEIAELSDFKKEVFDECIRTDELAWKKREAISVIEVLPKSNDTVFTFEVIKTPSFYTNGERKGLIIVGRNISNRIQIEENSTLARKVIDSSSDGVIITNANKRIVYVNPSFTRTTGYSEEEALDRDPKFLSSGIQDEQFYKTMWEKINLEGKWEGEIWNKRKDGKFYIEWMSIYSITNEQQQVVNYVALFSDISESVRIMKDVMLAAELQRKFLPANLENQQILVETIYQPLQYVSGDFYDFFWNEEQQVLSGYLLDVMGHGFATALQSSCFRVLFQQVGNSTKSLQQKLFEINNEATKYFSTEFFGAVINFEFDFKNKVLHYISGGINHFIRLSEQHLVDLKVKGSFIGITPDIRYEQHSLAFKSGDSFFFMSDGLFDILPNDLINQKSSFESFVSKLSTFSKGEERTDDIAAICIKVK